MWSSCRAARTWCPPSRSSPGTSRRRASRPGRGRTRRRRSSCWTATNAGPRGEDEPATAFPRAVRRARTRGPPQTAEAFGQRSKASGARLPSSDPPCPFPARMAPCCRTPLLMSTAPDTDSEGRGPSVHAPDRRSCLVHCDPGAGRRPGTRGITPSCHPRRRGRRPQRLCVALPAHCDRPLPHVALDVRPAAGQPRAVGGDVVTAPRALWPERTVGRAVTTTGPPQFQQVGSAPPGASASCPATSQQRQVELTSIRPSTGPFSPSVFHMCHPRWDVGQRGAHARQRPLRRRERQRFLHHSRGWPLLSHRGERPSHLPASANLRTRASGTTRSPTAELPLDVAGRLPSPTPGCPGNDACRHPG
jgi:hypothetical protein